MTQQNSISLKFICILVCLLLFYNSCYKCALYSADSWLGNSEKQDQDENADPQKRVTQHSQPRDTVSASTVDSYDAAFMRQRNSEQTVPQQYDNQQNLNDDDFFGS